MGGEERTDEVATGRPLDENVGPTRLQLEGDDAVRWLYTPDEWRWALERLATRRAARDDGVRERYCEMMYQLVAGRHDDGDLDAAA